MVGRNFELFSTSPDFLSPPIFHLVYGWSVFNVVLLVLNGVAFDIPEMLISEGAAAPHINK